MSCDHHYANPVDFLGLAVLDDAQNLTLLDALPPEVVELIHASPHRIEVRIQFVADSERLRGPDGELL